MLGKDKQNCRVLVCNFTIISLMRKIEDAPRMQAYVTVCLLKMGLSRSEMKLELSTR